MPRRHVEHVERALVNELRQIMDDSERFIPVLQNSIDRLSSDPESMAGGGGQVQERLDEARERLECLEVSWIEGRITNETREQMRAPLEAEKVELDESLTESSPEAVAAEEETRNLLKGAMDFLRTAQRRQDMGLGMWQFTLNPKLAESDDLHRYRLSAAYPVPVQHGTGSEKLDQLLTDLDAEVTLRHDSIELTGAVKLELPLEESHTTHPYAPTMGGRIFPSS